MSRRRATATVPLRTPIERAAEEWSDAVLHCRSNNNHSWTDERWEYRRGYGYYRITWHCGNGCGVIRRQDQDAEGFIIGPGAWLDYSGNPDYLSRTGRISSDDRAVIRRTRRERMDIPTSTINEPPHFRGEYTRAGAHRRAGRSS